MDVIGTHHCAKLCSRESLKKKYRTEPGPVVRSGCPSQRPAPLNLSLQLKPNVSMHQRGERSANMASVGIQQNKKSNFCAEWGIGKKRREETPGNEVRSNLHGGGGGGKDAPPPASPQGTVLSPYMHTFGHRNCRRKRNNKASDDLRWSRCPCRADDNHIRPRGKHGCAIRFHFRESDSKCPAKVQGIPVASGSASQHTDPRDNTVTRNKILVLTKGRPAPTPRGWTRGGNKANGG